MHATSSFGRLRSSDLYVGQKPVVSTCSGGCGASDVGSHVTEEDEAAVVVVSTWTEVGVELDFLLADVLGEGGLHVGRQVHVGHHPLELRGELRREEEGRRWPWRWRRRWWGWRRWWRWRARHTWAPQRSLSLPIIERSASSEEEREEEALRQLLVELGEDVLGVGGRRGRG